MQCGSLDNDASVTWKVNGTDVKARRREEGPRLILLEVNMSSNGLYSCFQNSVDQRRDQITLRVGPNFGLTAEFRGSTTNIIFFTKQLLLSVWGSLWSNAISVDVVLGHRQADSANKISSAAKCLNENGMAPIPKTGRGPSTNTPNTLPICDRNACQELEVG
ncbi:hypothetical protein DNTS_023701 [Danionella cerebrum]|uniref:Ig-like domain-containing protein n=1 Tax=Danionella cerebrum TaxID=2873325 RepID=A0A553MMN0_9TELE|nr:hypothetical protein DNTS_023701 [Danionella translucida]